MVLLDPLEIPSTDDSSGSSTPSTPGPRLDDEGDFFLQSNESQSSLGASSTHDETIPRPPPRTRPKHPIDRLPPEILIAIVAKLSSSADILNCLKVSKTWSRCCVDLLWHRPMFTSWDRLLNIVSSVQTTNSYWPYADLIKRLNLSNLNDQINDGTLQPFIGCKRIERLTLTSCGNLTDQGVMALVEGNRSLLALDITGLSSITDVTIQALAMNCHRLQGLNITNCRKVTDESLVRLAESCKYLKRVSSLAIKI